MLHVYKECNSVTLESYLLRRAKAKKNTEEEEREGGQEE